MLFPTAIDYKLTLIVALYVTAVDSACRHKTKRNVSVHRTGTISKTIYSTYCKQFVFVRNPKAAPFILRVDLLQFEHSENSDKGGFCNESYTESCNMNDRAKSYLIYGEGRRVCPNTSTPTCFVYPLKMNLNCVKALNSDNCTVVPWHQRHIEFIQNCGLSSIKATYQVLRSLNSSKNIFNSTTTTLPSLRIRETNVPTSLPTTKNGTDAVRLPQENLIILYIVIPALVACILAAVFIFLWRRRKRPKITSQTGGDVFSITPYADTTTKEGTVVTVTESIEYVNHEVETTAISHPEYVNQGVATSASNVSQDLEYPYYVSSVIKAKSESPYHHDDNVYENQSSLHNIEYITPETVPLTQIRELNESTPSSVSFDYMEVQPSRPIQHGATQHNQTAPASGNQGYLSPIPRSIAESENGYQVFI